MRRVLDRRLMGAVALAMVAIGLFALGRFLGSKGMAVAGEFGSIAAFFLGILVAVGPPLARLFRGPLPASTAAVGPALDDLALALSRQWEQEERLRRINDPRPLPVRWEITATARSATPPMPRARTDDSSPRPDLSGEFSEVLSFFRQAPSHRLVILGPAGAGKSVLVTNLARAMLDSREPGMPVPFIVSAAAWNPGTSLVGWIADQLVRDYPGLTVRVRSATGRETRLADEVAANGLLPILDGLDELPEKLQVKAITELNLSGSTVPLIVTSRSEEYLEAIQANGRAISRTAVVELRPLKLADVKEYLTEATSTVPDHRWDTVFRKLDEEPGGALATTLSNPLMVWLARTIYEPGSNDPSDLLDPRFPDQLAIEDHLLDAFIPAIYADERKSRRRRWSPEQAQRWLAFLAGYLDRTNQQDVEWWRLDRADEYWRPLAVAIRSVVSWAVGLSMVAWVLRQHPAWRYNAHTIPGYASYFISQGKLGRRMLPALTYMARLVVPSGQARADIESQTNSVIRSLHHLPSLSVGLVLIAAVAGTCSLWLTGEHAQGAKGPVALKYPLWSTAARLLGSPFAPVVLIVGIVYTGLLFHNAGPSMNSDVTKFVRSESAQVLIIFCVAHAAVTSLIPLASPVDVSQSNSPRNLLRLDNWAENVRMVLSRAISVATVWLLLGSAVALAYGIYQGTRVMSALVLGRTDTASGRFTDARFWLSLSRRMPWRLMTFLDDAHQRGVLRLTGAVYRFRHIRLEERLAARYPHWSRWLASVVVRLAGPVVGTLALADYAWWPDSTAPWSEPLWQFLFAAAAAELASVVPVSGSAGDLHHAGAGLAQFYNDPNGDSAWVVCALPAGAPVLVARTIWDALKRAGHGAHGDPLTATGLPVAAETGGNPLPEYPHVIDSDQVRVPLYGGTWGRGVLVRASPAESWRWQGAELYACDDSLGDDSDDDDGDFGRSQLEAHGPELELRIDARLPFAVAGLAITPQMHQTLVRELGRSDLSRVVADLFTGRGARSPRLLWRSDWDQGSFNRDWLNLTIAGSDGAEVLTCYVDIAFQSLQASATILASAVIRIADFAAYRRAIEAAGGGTSDRGLLRIRHDELIALFAAGWHTLAEVLPGVFIADLENVRPFGPAVIEFGLSAGPPARSIPGQHRVRRHLRQVVEFSPADAHRSRSFRLGIRRSDASVIITGPLIISRERRRSRTRRAVAFMARRSGYINTGAGTSRHDEPVPAD
jgi:hypothetical protein